MSGDGPPIEVDVKESKKDGRKYIVVTFPTFPGPLRTIGFTPSEARTFAGFLLTKADEIDGL